MNCPGFLLLALLAPGVCAATPVTPCSPYQGRELPMRVFRGDTHVHTSLSSDANVSGNLTLGPVEALRFARGEEITATSGQPARLERPLDFLVIADHAEYLGWMPRLRAGDPALLVNPVGKRWHAMFGGGKEQASAAVRELTHSFIGGKPALGNDAIEAETWP